jgi:uncharacterized membrane protein
MPISLAAQDNANPTHPHKYHHYQLVDVGTFGGPQSYLFNPGVVVRSGLLNNQGTLAGSADTAIDPRCSCYAENALQWKNGVTTDLGVLPGGIGSQVNWISPNGLMVGISDNGQQDPPNPGLLQTHAVVWHNDTMTDLGTFFGGYDTWATSVNSRGEIAGLAYNTIPDPDSMFGYGYQLRAFYWNNGVVQDLGTLGSGNDAAAGVINERGQVIGVSYTSSTPSAICAGLNPFFTFTTGSFLWDRKNGMKDIGGLGGACTLANDLNNHGQIIGGSSLPGDAQFHPFVWNADGMTDLLDPSDSSFGFAIAENAQGEVVGEVCDAVACYAVVWRKRAGHWERTNLNPATQNAFAGSINASEQVVGNIVINYSNNATSAFVSENGRPLIDLNTLVPPGSGLQLYEADQVNDRGEISAQGKDANGNNHVVLLIPCDDDHPDVEGCDYSMVDASIAVAQTTPAVRDTSTDRVSQSLMRRTNRFRFPGLGTQRPN